VSEQYCYIPQFFVREFVRNCTTLQHEEICKANNLKCLSQNRVQPIEVAIFLFDIFICFGGPIILQTDNGREFTAEGLWNVQMTFFNKKCPNGCRIRREKIGPVLCHCIAPVSLVFGQNPLCYFSLLKEANEQ
ncbi:3484_t:CDS:2, partial [Gigaspora rosea]